MTQTEPPRTPDGTRRWRKSNFAEAGCKVIHPGLINDMAKFDPLVKHGKMTQDSDHVDTVFGHGPQTNFDEYMNSESEKMYASKKMEPLGKSFSRGHELPEETRDSAFAFGVMTGQSEPSKNLLYPTVTEDEAIHEAMYRKSHGTYQPGVQVDRQYKWNNTNIDVTTHRFGKKDKNLVKNGVGLCMNSAKDIEVPKTRLVQTHVEKLKSLKDQLGKARNLGLGDTNLPKDHTFGVRGTADMWDASDCIQGDYSAAEQAPDADLGTSATPGWRNNSCERRAFGCPTLRTDIPYPDKRSVSDNQNYGDDVSAEFLLYPPAFACAGVEDKDFAEPRTPQQIKQYFVTAKILPEDFGQEEFQRLWIDAGRRCDITEDGIVSVAEFQLALNDYLDAKDDGNLDEWYQKTTPGQ